MKASLMVRSEFFIFLCKQCTLPQAPKIWFSPVGELCSKSLFSPGLVLLNLPLGHQQGRRQKAKGRAPVQSTCHKGRKPCRRLWPPSERFAPWGTQQSGNWVN